MFFSFIHVSLQGVPGCTLFLFAQDRAEYYGIDDGPPSPALTQCFYDEDDSMTESELELDIKRVFSPMYYERKRKRDEMENDEDDNDA